MNTHFVLQCCCIAGSEDFELVLVSTGTHSFQTYELHKIALIEEEHFNAPELAFNSMHVQHRICTP